MGTLMDKCKNHPIKFAAGRCKRCHIPICSECKIQVEEGIFCSEECVDQFRTFQSRMADFGPTRSKFSLTAWIKYLITVAVLVGVIYGALAFWLGETDPGAIISALMKQINVLF